MHTYNNRQNRAKNGQEKQMSPPRPTPSAVHGVLCKLHETPLKEKRKGKGNYEDMPSVSSVPEN